MYKAWLARPHFGAFSFSASVCVRVSSRYEIFGSFLLYTRNTNHHLYTKLYTPLYTPVRDKFRDLQIYKRHPHPHTRRLSLFVLTFSVPFVSFYATHLYRNDIHNMIWAWGGGAWCAREMCHYIYECNMWKLHELKHQGRTKPSTP